ncbi:MAG: hypothetical protein EPO31_00775 [Gammaproteobacteria bacterium]|jgi:hypothetical protein|nr:MAG: hypothetical protein EPO31_00775 [Gammaproteobacteria bacterium]
MTEHDHKLITCILPKGIASHVVERLKSEKRIITVCINSARGLGKLMPGARRDTGEQMEKDILCVVVGIDRAEEIFEYLFYAADIDRPHGGFIYMSALALASRYALPALPDED